MKIINKTTGATVATITTNHSMTLDEAIELVGEIHPEQEDENVQINGEWYYYDALDMDYSEDEEEDENEAMTLMEMTGHEAGIVCYGGNTVAVVNWGQFEEDRLPTFGPAGMMLQWPEAPGTLAVAEKTYRRFSDVRDELPGRVWLTDETDDQGRKIADTDLDILADEFGDLLRLFTGVGFDGEALTADDYEGAAYTLPDGKKILVLDMWN